MPVACDANGSPASLTAPVLHTIILVIYDADSSSTSRTYPVYPAMRTAPLHLLQVLYYLSGLTCTDENFIQKAGAQRTAALRGVALVAPDTSPRGAGIAGEVRLRWFIFLVK